MQIKRILALSLVFVLLCPLLLYAETLLTDTNPVIIARGLLCAAVIFFALTMGEIGIADYFRKHRVRSLPGVLIAAKGVRFLVSLLVIVLYGLAQFPGLIAFTSNIFICFIVSLVFTTIIHMKEESKNNTLF